MYGWYVPLNLLLQYALFSLYSKENYNLTVHFNSIWANPLYFKQMERSNNGEEICRFSLSWWFDRGDLWIAGRVYWQTVAGENSLFHVANCVTSGSVRDQDLTLHCDLKMTQLTQECFPYIDVYMLKRQVLADSRVYINR